MEARDLAESTLFLLHKIVAIFHYLFRLNYEIVSLILDLIGGVICFLTAVVNGIHIGIVEFIDQYGQWCWNTVRAIGWFLVTCLTLIGSVFSSIASLLVSCFNFLSNCVIFLLSLPNLVEKKLTQVTVFAEEKFQEMLAMPFQFFSFLVNGFVMFLSGIWNGFLFVIGSIYHCTTAMMHWTVCTIWSLFCGVCNILLKICSSPVVVGKKVVCYLMTVPYEAVCGLLLCIIFIYLWRTGVIPYILNSCLLVLRRILVNVAMFWLGVFEFVMTLYVPYAPIVIRFVRYSYRPFLRLLSWIISAFFNLFRRRRRPLAPPTPSRTLTRPPLTREPSVPIRTTARDNLEEEEEERDERLLCVICQDLEKRVMLEPCNHLCLCEDCASSLMAEGGFRVRQRCPICRSAIQRTVTVYM